MKRLQQVHRHEGESDEEFRSRCHAAARGEVEQRLETMVDTAKTEAEYQAWRAKNPPIATLREDLTRCRCGRRLAVIYVCVYCRKEEDECKCTDLTEDE